MKEQVQQISSRANLVVDIAAYRRRAQRSDLTAAVLHPVFGRNALFVWAEVAEGVPCPPPPASAGGLTPAHPRCLDVGDWLPRVPTVPPNTPRGDLSLPLPGRDAPLPSPAAGGDPEATGPMRHWVVGGVRLPMGAALPWLDPAPDMLADGALRWGPGWPFWWEAAALVRRLVADGAVVPSVMEGPTGARHVVWRAIPGRRDHDALDALADRAPQAAVSPQMPPSEALSVFCALYADALVRQVAGQPRELARWRRPFGGKRPSRTRWLHDLFDPEPQHLPRRGLRPAMLRWLRDPAGVEGPGRLVLRLDEPPERVDPAKASWPLRVYLESPAEPGVLEPADEIWAEGDPSAQATLTTTLERAGPTVPALWACLEDEEGTASLSTDQAWDLLSAGRGKLERLGITVLVPDWWHQRPPHATLQLASAGSGLFTADALVRFSWQVALGDGTVLSAEEFERQVALRSPLVWLGTGWAPLAPGTAAAVRARWEGGPPQGEATAGQAVLMALQADAEADPQEGDASPVLADEALGALLSGLRDATGELEEPGGFQGTLRPYQRRGTAWLHTRAQLGLGGVLADDMGLGKTVQVLALIARRQGERAAAGAAPAPTLIVCPTSVVANWAAEAARFTPELSVRVHQGIARARGAEIAEAGSGADIVVTSYALLLRDAEGLAAVRWDGVILDEAQNVKNASAKQAQAARRLTGRYRLALTGTPVENALSDLWSIFAFVQPGYLGSWERFRKRIANPIERGQDAAALAALRHLIGPFVLRRSKRDPGIADELPEKTETVERCHLTREQAALYEAISRELLQRVEESTGMERRAAILLALLRLKQVCNHPVHYGVAGGLDGRSGKLARLEELLDEVAAEGQRALVFTQYAAWGRQLAEHLRTRLAGCPVWEMDGATPPPERTKRIAAFQEGDGAGVFVLSLKAGGTGLNLTAARHVFHFDRWWNPAVEQQATDRAYRIGQRHPVHVHALLSVGTLEERIDELLRRKQGLAEGVLGSGGEAWLTELDDAALREILTLRRSALGT